MLDSLSIYSLLSPYVLGGSGTLIVLLIIVVIIYIITSQVGKPFKIGLGPIKLDFTGGKKLQVPPGQNQNNYLTKKEKYLIAEQIKIATSEVESEKVELKYDTLRRQMNYAEENIGEIKSIMSQTYTTLLEKKLPEEEKNKVKSHPEYKNYQILLRISLNECVLRLLKKSFKVNHLDEMTPDEWDNYTSHKTDTAVQQMSDFFDIMYSEPFTVTRQELSDGNLENSSDFRKEMKDVLVNARNIQVKNNKKINELTEQLKQKIKSIIENNNGKNEHESI